MTDTLDASIARFFAGDIAVFDMEYGNWLGDREFREEDVNRDPEGKFAEQAGGGKGEETKSVESRERDLSVRDILYGDFPKQQPRSKQVKDVARQLMERGSTALKALGIESGRIEGPNPETDEMLSRVIASEISDALTQTGSATDWYTHRVTEAMNIAAEMYPELASDRHARTAYTAALAVTSQGEVVPSNVRLADQVYRHYRETGRFPTNVQAKERISMNTNFRKLNGLLDAGSPAEMTEFLNQDFTVRELGTLGFEVGGENVNTQVKGSAILGAKIGQGFFQNLNGNYDPVTMDLWFMRGWGRLTGTLQGQLDPAEFAKTRNRFENALRKAGETPADSPPALKERAQEISAQHERDYRKYRAEFDSGERKKSELVLSAQRMVYAMDGINQAPRSGGHREWMRSVINRTREVLAEQGTSLTNADIQATWWYPEKSLYEKLGSREARDINVDYSDALQDLARKNGISEEAIARAVRTVDRRPGRAAARDQRGGGEGVWAKGHRTAAPQALDLALDRAIAGFFGYDREFKEHEVKRDEEGKFATQASTRSFVSPSVAEGLSLSQARQALGGRRQQVLAQVSQRVDRRLGLRETQNTAVIGAWADGAENSLMTVTSGDPQLIRAAAAIKGAIANQKAVLVFQPGEGEHEMASFAMQGDIADIHNRLLQGGLQFHTLEPTEDGARVHILVMDDETAAAITEVAGDTEIETVAGNGEFIGTTKDDGTDAEQRSDAIRAYREAIDQVAEQRQGQGPDLREIWSDNLDYWRAETQTADDRRIDPPASRSTGDGYDRHPTRAGPLLRVGSLRAYGSQQQQQPTTDAEFREENVKRDKKGKFAKQAGGGKPSKAAPAATPSLEQQRETGQNFVQHQRMIAAMQAMNTLPEGMRRPADVMLDYGRQFYFDAESFECPKGKRHMCYENAGMAAILDPDLTYVEGHVLVNGIPIEHAWNTDHNGKVIDPTITDAGTITGYFGLPIEAAYLRKTIQRTKMWGILDPMYNEQRLYDDPESYVKKDVGLPLPRESQEEKEQLDKLLKMWRGAQDREFREEDVKRDEEGKFATQAGGGGAPTVASGTRRLLLRYGFRNMSDLDSPAQYFRNARGDIIEGFDDEWTLITTNKQGDRERSKIGAGTESLFNRLQKEGYRETARVDDEVIDDLKEKISNLKIESEDDDTGVITLTQHGDLKVELHPNDNGTVGEWTIDDWIHGTQSGEGQEALTNALAEWNYYASAEHLALAVNEVANKLGFDPAMINYRYDDRVFDLGGKAYQTAGLAYLQSGKIEIFAKHTTPQAVRGLVAHEIMHQKYQTALDDYSAQNNAWIKDSRDNDDARPRDERVMDSAGFMTAAGAEKYPLVVAYDKILGGGSARDMRSRMDKFIEDDGITDYSRDWWAAAGKNEATNKQAFHETLAEMAKLEEEGSLGRLLWYKRSRTWKPLYNLVKKNYRQRKLASDTYYVLGDKSYRQWQRAA